MASAHTAEPSPSDWLTPSELAAEWHVSARTVVRYIADGKLPATKLPSGHHRILRADANAALKRVSA